VEGVGLSGYQTVTEKGVGRAPGGRHLDRIAFIYCLVFYLVDCVTSCSNWPDNLLVTIRVLHFTNFAPFCNYLVVREREGEKRLIF
jgi:hypothetical protein